MKKSQPIGSKCFKKKVMLKKIVMKKIIIYLKFVIVWKLTLTTHTHIHRVLSHKFKMSTND